MSDWGEWTHGARVDGFEFRRLQKISDTGSRISGVQSCNISWDWATPERVSGSMVRRRKDGEGGFIDLDYIRVLYVPTIDGVEHAPIELGTFVAVTTRAVLDGGWWTEEISLKSPLSRYMEDAIWWTSCVSKGRSAVAAFKVIMNRLGGSYAINGVTDWKFKRATVTEFGSAPLDLLTNIATHGGASRRYEIACDTHGRLTFGKRVPSTATAGIVRVGNGGVTKDGIERASSWQTAPNRVALQYSEDDFTVYGRAEAKAEADSRGRLKYPVCRAQMVNDLDYNNSWRGTYTYTGDGTSRYHDISGETGDTYTYIERVTIDGVEADGWTLSNGRAISWETAPPDGSTVYIDGIWVLRPVAERRENAQAAITVEAAKRLDEYLAQGNLKPVWTVPLVFLPLEPNKRYEVRLGNGRTIIGTCEKLDYSISDGTIHMQAGFREVSDTIDE